MPGLHYRLTEQAQASTKRSNVQQTAKGALHAKRQPCRLIELVFSTLGIELKGCIPET